MDALFVGLLNIVLLFYIIFHSNAKPQNQRSICNKSMNTARGSYTIADIRTAVLK